MNARLPKYVPAFLVSAALLSACGAENATSPTAPTEPVALLTAEPSSVLPEFSPTRACRVDRHFGLRFFVVVRPVSDLFLHGVRVVFVDRFGRRSFPFVDTFDPSIFALPSNPGPIPIPSSPSIPIPTMTGTAIPGALGFDPLLIHGGRSRSLPFFLDFGCGIPSIGTVVLNFETRDRNGRTGRPELRLQVRD